MLRTATYAHDWPKGIQIRDDGGRCRNAGFSFKGLAKGLARRDDFIPGIDSPFFEDI